MFNETITVFTIVTIRIWASLNYITLTEILKFQNLIIEFQVNSDGTWYRKYSDGFIQQGGKRKTSASRTIIFSKAFTKPPLNVTVTHGANNTGGAQALGILDSSITTKQMIITSYGIDGNFEYKWSAEGY